MQKKNHITFVYHENELYMLRTMFLLIALELLRNIHLHAKITGAACHKRKRTHIFMTLFKWRM